MKYGDVYGLEPIYIQYRSRVCIFTLEIKSKFSNGKIKFKFLNYNKSKNL